MASKKFLVDIDLSKNSLLNAVIQVLASAPSDPAVGQTYFDSTLNRPQFRGASSWLNLTDRSLHTGSPSADVNHGGFKITNLGTPTANSDAATKQYVDENAGAGFVPTGYIAPVQYATTTNITIATATTIQGETLVEGDRVLVKNQTTPSQNGVYVFTSGALQLAVDGQIGTGITLGTYVYDQFEENTYVLTSEAAYTFAIYDPAAGALAAVQTAEQKVRYIYARAASTANVASLSGEQTIDGVALVTGDAVLLKNQSTASQNGVYTVTAGAWEKIRGTAAGNASDDLLGYTVFVLSGTANAQTHWTRTAANTWTKVILNQTEIQALRLDQFAAPTTSLNINSQRLTNVANGTAANDAVNLSQLQNAVNGTDWKTSVKAATTANITLSGTQTVDGIALVDGDRALVKNQSSQPTNGIYIVRAGAWERAADAVTGTITEGATVFVEQGTTNGNTQWRVQDPVTTVGTDNMIWTQVGAGTTYTQGPGIVISGNVIEIDDTVVARKFTALIGNGVATSIAVAHALDNQWVTAQVFEVATLKQVECDITLTSTTTTTFTFNVAPTTNQYRVVITG